MLQMPPSAVRGQDSDALPVPPPSVLPVAGIGIGIGGGVALVPAPSIATLLRPDAPIPANGSFVLQTAGTGFTAGNAQLIDPNGNAIDGTVRMIGTFTIWTPNRELTPGTQYQFVIANPAVGGAASYPIEVVQAWTPGPVPITSKLELQRVDASASTACCSPVPGVSKGKSGCFATQVRSSVRMNAALSSAAPLARVTQLLFRLTFVDQVPAAQPNFVPLANLSSLNASWSTAAAEYCIALEAIDATSGRTFDYADLSPRCLPHADLGEIGQKTVTIDPAVLDHTVCPVPPPGYDARWCEANHASCSADLSLIGCENYDNLCQRDGTPRQAMAGTGGGAAGALGTAGVPAAGMAAQESAGARAPNAGSSSVAAGGSSAAASGTGGLQGSVQSEAGSPGTGTAVAGSGAFSIPFDTVGANAPPVEDMQETRGCSIARPAGTRAPARAFWLAAAAAIGGWGRTRARRRRERAPR